MRELTQVTDELYEGTYDGKPATMGREHGTTPNGNPMGGRWVLRVDGEVVDFDQYRNDLFDRYNIDTIGDPELY